MLTSGLDALNINPLNPELLSALNAFMSVAVTRNQNPSGIGNNTATQQGRSHPSNSPSNFYPPNHNTSSGSHNAMNTTPNPYSPQTGRRGGNSNSSNSMPSTWRSS